MKYQSVAKADRQMLAQRGQQVQQSRDQRRTLEATAVNVADRKQGGGVASVKLPRSPIVAKSASQLPKGQAPPKVQRSSQAGLAATPQSAPAGRQAQGAAGKVQAESRQAPSTKQSAPGSNPGQPQAQPNRTPKGAAQPTQQPKQQRAAQPQQQQQQQPKQQQRAAPGGKGADAPDNKGGKKNAGH